MRRPGDFVTLAKYYCIMSAHSKRCCVKAHHHNGWTLLPLDVFTGIIAAVKYRNDVFVTHGENILAIMDEWIMKDLLKNYILRSYSNSMLLDKIRNKCRVIIFSYRFCGCSFFLYLCLCVFKIRNCLSSIRLIYYIWQQLSLIT